MALDVKCDYCGGPFQNYFHTQAGTFCSVKCAVSAKREEAGIRRARIEDGEFLYRCAMDPETRINSSRSDLFSLEDHKKWLEVKLADPLTKMYVLIDDGPSKVAQCRYGLDRNGYAEIAVSTEPTHRRMGHAAKILRESQPLAIEAFSGHGVVAFAALILPHNIASLRLFSQDGFIPVGTEKRMGKLHFRYEKAITQTP